MDIIELLTRRDKKKSSLETSETKYPVTVTPYSRKWNTLPGISVLKTSQLMLYREIMAVCSQIHTKHINTLCGQNEEFLNVKLAVHIVTTGL